MNQYIKPKFDCTNLQAQIQLATGTSGIFSSTLDARNFGMFSAVLAATNRRAFGALDPVLCNEFIMKNAAGKPSVSLVYDLPNCDVLDTECDTDDFDCTGGPVNLPTTETKVFNIEECIKLKFTVKEDCWNDSCCGLESYYDSILRARQGTNYLGQVERIIRDSSAAIRAYSGRDMLHVNEQIKRTLGAPTVGVMAKMEEKLIAKVDAAVGYNWTPATSDPGAAPVGVGTYKIPCLYSQTTPGCSTPTSHKSVDAKSLQRAMKRMVDTNPICQRQRLYAVGGYKFMEFADEINEKCCDNNGNNQDVIMRKSLSFFDDMFYCPAIDALFPDDPNTFFLITEGSLAFFWLNKHQSRAWPCLTDLTEHGKYRKVGNVIVPFGNCFGEGFGFGFDTMIYGTVGAGCMDNPVYTTQMIAEWDLWTNPAVGCDNPVTGIYRLQLTDLC